MKYEIKNTISNKQFCCAAAALCFCYQCFLFVIFSLDLYGTN
jgi:hypothetical protein